MSWKKDYLKSCRDLMPHCLIWRWGNTKFREVDEVVERKMKEEPCSRLLKIDSVSWAIAHHRSAWVRAAQKNQLEFEESRDERGVEW